MEISAYRQHHVDDLTVLVDRPIQVRPAARDLDLPRPREREVAVNAELWGWIAADDRQVLMDAGFAPDDLAAPLEE